MKTSHFVVRILRCDRVRCVVVGLLAFIATTSAGATPTTTGLVFWVDAADPNNDSVTPTVNDTALSSWKNKAPIGQQLGVSSVDQATAGFQPLIKTSVNGLNRLPVVRFDGVDDFMQSIALSSTIATPQVFVVWRAFSSGGTGGILFDSFSGGGNRLESAYENDRIDMFAGGVAPTNDFLTGSDATGTAQPLYMTATFAGASSTLRVPTTAGALDPVNGTMQIIGPNNPGSNPTNGFTLGGRFEPYEVSPGVFDRFGLDGYIAEMLVYSTPLTGTTLTDTEKYLHDKWFVPTPEPNSLSLLAIGTILALRQRRRPTKS